MKSEKLNSWRVPFVIFAIVCVGIVAFVLIQSWSKGRISEPDILDLSLVQTIHDDTHHKSLVPQGDEPYHYEFFSLLDEPVPVRVLPELEAKENPALKAKYRQGLNKLSGKYAIQLPSFRHASEALSVVRDLNVAGHHAIVVNESSNGPYRVRVEGGVNRESAENVLLAVEKSTGLKGSVVGL